MVKLFQINKNLLVWILFLIVILSFFVCLYLIKKSIYYYKISNAIRLNPIGIKLDNNTNNLQDSYGGLVLWGDSRIKQWSDSKTNNSLKVKNLGVSGETSSQSVLRFKHLMPNLKPDIILCQIGINDLKTIALFPDKRNDIIENCKQNILEISLIGQTKSKIILTTIFPLGKLSFLRKLMFQNSDVSEAINEVNKYIKSLEDLNKIYVWDTYSLIQNHNKKNKLYKDDLHLNEIGYNLLNNRLANILNQVNNK